MNHTIKGIIIVAAIASMLVVGMNMIPLAQNTYASSHRHQDNILNQRDESYRSPGSESSNVAIQESGKGNSPTAYSDQSSNTQEQNQPTLQQKDPQSNNDKDKSFPITLNVLPDQRITNTNVNPNRNTAGSNSGSASDASNNNTIDNTALARQRQAEASCAVALTCSEGSTTVTPPPPTTGTLEITKVCTPSCPGTDFRIRVNDMPEFTLQSGQTQVVTLSPGTIFRVSEAIPEGFDEPESTGDCGGTIRAGQTLHCTITNFPTPPTSTCNPDKIGGQPATPIAGSSGCTAFLPAASPAAQVAAFEEQCRGIEGFNLSGDADTTGLTCTFPSTPPT
jgi:hypothetical protein